MLEVAIKNFSTKLADADMAAYVGAVQTQIARDFAPLHGLVGVTLKIYDAADTPPANGWMIGFFDNSDVAGALGYHDLTPSGYPLGKIFVETTQQAGESVSVDFSHETLEMLMDPLIATCLQVNDTTFYAFEACDACEDDSFGYDIGGVLVSDFCFMPWWTGTPGALDFKGHIQKAGEILPGGYIGAYQSTGGSWTQITNMAKANHHLTSRVGSRFDKRGRRGALKLSTAH